MARSNLPDGHYKLYTNNGSLLLRLPRKLSKTIPADQVYRLEVDDDGIHLYPVSPEDLQNVLNGHTEIPAWARRESAERALDTAAIV